MYKLVLVAIGFFAIYLVLHFINHGDDNSLSQTVETEVNKATQKANAKNQPVDQMSSLISTAPENASVSILQPNDGAILSSPVLVKFGVSNMQIAPAGTNTENSGHHHLLIDMEELPDLSHPLPANDQLLHFGKGQTEAQIELNPGTHTLQLLLGNYLHIPHNAPVISDKITITIQ